jgi:hypothetical protein
VAMSECQPLFSLKLVTLGRQVRNPEQKG